MYKVESPIKIHIKNTLSMKIAAVGSSYFHVQTIDQKTETHI